MLAATPANRLQAQGAPSVAASPPDGERIHVDVFTPARLARPLALAYPQEEQFSFQDGEVTVSFMIGRDGKAFEAAVVDSVGGKSFEKAALVAIEKGRFEPAKVNGQPIESAIQKTIRFYNSQFSHGASDEFISVYKELDSAIQAGSRSAADSAQQRLRPNSLYESAYVGFATQMYAARWGTVAEQLAGLKRAIGRDRQQRYLPLAQYKGALLARMHLELRMKTYAEALETWKLAMQLGLDRATIERYRPLLDDLAKLRTDERDYTVEGALSELGVWSLDLFKHRFQATVLEGHIQSVKLYCNRAFVQFDFDPTLQYEFASKHGDCTILLEGEPGTRFTLFQS